MTIKLNTEVTKLMQKVARLLPRALQWDDLCSTKSS